MTEPVICPLWVNNDYRFRSRRYHAWDRPCQLCGRKVIVSDAVKQRLGSGSGAVIVCEQCALVRAAETDALRNSESKPADQQERCPTCAALKAQEAAAALELARVRGLPDSEGVYRKWAHLSDALHTHQSKAHNREARGRER